MTRSKWMLLVTGLLLIGGAAGALSRLKTVQHLGKPGLRVTRVDESGRLRIELPERVGNMTSTNVEPTALEVATLPKDTTFGKRLYTSPDGFQIFTSVVMMGSDRTSIHKPEFCLEAQGWQIVRRETSAVHIERPHAYDLPVRKFITGQVVRGANGGTTRWGGVYAFWFVAEDHVTASHLTRMKWITYDLLTRGVLPRWAYVSCFVTCPAGREEAAFERVRQFIAAAVPEFQVATVPPVVAVAP